MHYRSHDQGMAASREGGLPPDGVCLQGGVHLKGVGQIPRDTWDTMGYGQQAGGMHPTGRHSCFLLKCSQ